MASFSRERLLMMALKENWNHARFVERQRLTFASIYGAIVAGVLALAFERVEAMLLLFVLSLLGLFATLKWNAEFQNHIKAIEGIVKLPQVRLGGYMALPLKLNLRIRWIFIALYLVLGTTWLLVLLLLTRFPIWLSSLFSIAYLAIMTMFVGEFQRKVDKELRSLYSTPAPLDQWQVGQSKMSDQEQEARIALFEHHTSQMQAYKNYILGLVLALFAAVAGFGSLDDALPCFMLPVIYLAVGFILGTIFYCIPRFLWYGQLVRSARSAPRNPEGLTFFDQLNNGIDAHARLAEGERLGWWIRRGESGITLLCISGLICVSVLLALLYFGSALRVFVCGLAGA